MIQVSGTFLVLCLYRMFLHDFHWKLFNKIVVLGSSKSQESFVLIFKPRNIFYSFLFSEATFNNVQNHLQFILHCSNGSSPKRGSQGLIL